MIACTREEPRLEPGPVPYELLERATQEVLAQVRGEQVRNRVRPKLTGTAQKLYNWLNRPTLWQGHSETNSGASTVCWSWSRCAPLNVIAV